MNALQEEDNTEKIRRRLFNWRRVARSAAVLNAIASWLGVVLTLVLLIGAIDFFCRIENRTWSYLFSACLFGTVGIVFYRTIFRAISAPLAIESLAELTEKHEPRLANRLLPAISWGESGVGLTNDPRPSDAKQFCRAERQFVWDVLSPLPWNFLLKWTPALNSWGLVGALLIVHALIYSQSDQIYRVGWQRLCAPWDSPAWPKYFEIEFDNCSEFVIAGESAEIIASEKNGKHINTFFLDRRELHGENFTRQYFHEMGTQFQHTIARLEQSIEVRVGGGDGITEWCKIEVIPKPTVVSRRVTAIDPAYLGGNSRVLGESLSILAGSRLAFAIELDSAVESLKLVKSQDAARRLVGNFAADSNKKSWRLDQVEIEEGGDFALEASLGNGLPVTLAQLEITLISDRPPEVKFETQLGTMQKSWPTTGSGEFPLVLVARDDWGLAKVQVEDTTGDLRLWLQKQVDGWELASELSELKSEFHFSPTEISFHGRIPISRLIPNGQVGKFSPRIQALDFKGNVTRTEPILVEWLTTSEFVARIHSEMGGIAERVRLEREKVTRILATQKQREQSEHSNVDTSGNVFQKRLQVEQMIVDSIRAELGNSKELISSLSDLSVVLDCQREVGADERKGVIEAVRMLEIIRERDLAQLGDLFAKVDSAEAVQVEKIDETESELNSQYRRLEEDLKRIEELLRLGEVGGLLSLLQRIEKQQEKMSGQLIELRRADPMSSSLQNDKPQFAETFREIENEIHDWLELVQGEVERGERVEIARKQLEIAERENWHGLQIDVSVAFGRSNIELAQTLQTRAWEITKQLLQVEQASNGSEGSSRTPSPLEQSEWGTKVQILAKRVSDLANQVDALLRAENKETVVPNRRQLLVWLREQNEISSELKAISDELSRSGIGPIGSRVLAEQIKIEELKSELQKAKIDLAWASREASVAESLRTLASALLFEQKSEATSIPFKPQEQAGDGNRDEVSQDAIWLMRLAAVLQREQLELARRSLAEQGSTAVWNSRLGQAIQVGQREVLTLIKEAFPKAEPAPEGEDIGSEDASLPSHLVAVGQKIELKLGKEEGYDATLPAEQSLALEIIEKMLVSSQPSGGENKSGEGRAQEQNATGSDGGAEAGNSGSPDRTQDRTQETDPRITNQERSVISEAWGHLPPDIREVFAGAELTRLPPEYRVRLLEYYRKLRDWESKALNGGDRGGR